MEQWKIDRINELGRLMQERELSELEREEQSCLRREYLNEFRRMLRGEEKPES